MRSWLEGNSWPEIGFKMTQHFKSIKQTQTVKLHQAHWPVHTGLRCTVKANPVKHWISPVVPPPRPLSFVPSHSAPLYSHSSPCAAPFLHPPHQSWGDARRQRQPDLRRSRRSHALRQVDKWWSGADPGGWDAHWPQCSGAHQHPPICQLHLCGHILPGHDRDYSSDHSQG